MSDSAINIKFKQNFTDEELEILQNTLSHFRTIYAEQLSSTIAIVRDTISESMQINLAPLQEAIKQQRIFIDESLGLSLAPLIESIRQQQAEIRNTLVNLNKINLEVPELYTEKIKPIYNSLYDELSENNLMDIYETDSNNIQESIDKKNLTLSDIIAIIALLITLISFIQDQLPDKQLERQIQSLNQLVEIQSELLEQNDNNNLSSD